MIKNFKSAILLLMFLSIASSCFLKVSAQELPNPMLLTPDVASLQQYTDVPVSYHTGIPSVSVPIYTIQVGSFSLPISLNYHTSGIKIAQDASSAGLGWSLNIPGTISREVRGLDDYSFNGFAFLSEEVFANVYNTDYFVDTGIMALPPSDNGLVLEYQAAQTALIKDPEPDLFSFNFGPYSGSFIVRNINGVRKGFLLTKEHDLDITVLGNQPSSLVFELKDSYGNTYIFDKYQRSETLSSSYTSQNTILDPTNSLSQNVIAWKISNVILARDRGNVQFHYQQQGNTYFSPISTTVTENTLLYSDYTDASCYSLMVDALALGDKSFNTTKTRTLVDHQLEKITFPGGELRIEWFDRNDIHGSGKRIGKIKVLDSKQNTTRIVKLNQSYFGSLNPDYGRLKLESIDVFGSSETSSPQTYRFEYYDEQIQLPRKDALNQTDAWGYWNSSNINNPWLPEMVVTDGITYYNSYNNENFYEGQVLPGRNMKPDFLKTRAYVLHKIIYPTGGYDEFEYELNDYVDSDNFLQLDATAEYIRFRAPSVEHLLNDVFTIEDPGNIKIEIDFISDTYDSNLAYYEMLSGGNKIDIYQIHANGDSSFVDSRTYLEYNHNLWDSNFEIYYDTQEWIVNLPPGNYRLYFNELAENETVLERFEISARVPYKITNYNSIESPKAGGLRVKRITRSDGSYRDFTYLNSYNIQQKDTILSSGKSYDSPQYSKIKHCERTCKETSSVNGQEVTQISHVDFNALVRSSITTNTLPSALNGYVVGYDKVQEVRTAFNGDKSIREMVFYNDPFLVPVHGPMNQPRLDQVSVGKMLSETGMKGDQEVSYKFSDYLIDYFYDGFIGGRYVPGIEEVVPYDIPALGCPLKYERNTMNSTDGSLPYDVSEKVYHYENEDHLEVTKTVAYNSNGQEVVTEYIYPEDIPVPTASQQELINNKITATPIITNYYIDSVLVESMETIFNTDNLPEKVITYNPTLNTYEDLVFYDEYDHRGNILQFHAKNNTNTSIIWGYNFTLPVARIENISISDISQNTIDSINSYTFSNGDDVASDIAFLQAELNSLMNNANYSVSLFTYKELIGVTSITDPNGKSTYYEYDEFGRLEYVRDHEGNIITQNQYHYKNQ